MYETLYPATPGRFLAVGAVTTGARDYLLFDEMKALFSMMDAINEVDLSVVRQIGNRIIAHCLLAGDPNMHPNGDRNGSLDINLLKSVFLCRSCGAKGDQFGLVALAYGWNKHQTWVWGNNRLGYKVPEQKDLYVPLGPRRTAPVDAPPPRWKVESDFEEMIRNVFVELEDGMSLITDGAALQILPLSAGQLASSQKEVDFLKYKVSMATGDEQRLNALHDALAFVERMRSYAASYGVTRESLRALYRKSK